MSELFDLYCTSSATDFREGTVVAMDGIDGFSDQYFEPLRPGDMIRFAVLDGGPRGVAESIEDYLAMPLVVGRVVRCDVMQGEVEVLSSSTLGRWCRSVEPTTESIGELQRDLPGAPLSDIVTRADRDGSGYWRSGVHRWRSLEEATAVGAFQDAALVRLVGICTNGSPGLVARVVPPTA